MNIDRRLLLASLASALPFAPARAETWPDQPIRLIVPFAAGGPADIIARLIGRVMGEQLGKPMVIDSRSGAGGAVGVEAAARARPDGTTLVLASSGAIVILPHIMPSMAYDPLKDLTPITQVLAVPQIISVRPGLGVSSVRELVALAKSSPNPLTFGSAGIGSSLHMAGELFKLRAGVDMTHVPYRGAAPAVTDLLGGRIDVLMADTPALISFVRSGQLPALGVTSAERIAILPDTPTAIEGGVPNMVSETWYGLLGPAGIPADRVAKLHAAAMAALADGDTKAQLLNQGGRIVGSSAADFTAFIQQTHATWGEVVRATGVKME
ncbi:tripartite-type tricarboxylate transporter receptor subunit TctC [Humitalea rosea]|uniref:Tripartite-type tricarboxylate transporter receptor subunit TctC n=1 Tax=Humitalea rosea TaxID=990373 RepID=A0A2W7IH68_9PROT|nr:tripartite tricarboxylate transporter substrate binding protein [Humitalea rosea]PZW45959.1 tripartite-type tricarboxylate transporter receptor subunit TctC [Humitalea rosea]